MFDIALADGTRMAEWSLPLTPFRRVVKDYFLICESYYKAIRRRRRRRSRRIDMGRRGLHDEGAELLRERLAGKVEIDLDTARRLFTLICVLHIRGLSGAIMAERPAVRGPVCLHPQRRALADGGGAACATARPQRLCRFGRRARAANSIRSPSR